MDPRIADFIRDNRKQYTREAIRQQLIEAGHDPAEIDATWAALDAPDPDATAGEGFWGRFALFVAGINVVVFLLVFLSTGMVNSIVLAVVLAIALGFGALIAWAIVGSTGPAQMGRTTAMVIGGVIPLVLALLIGGSCYALVGSIGPPPPPPHEGGMELQLHGAVTFAGSGAAFCQVQADGTGFSIYPQEGSLGQIEGRPVHASVDSFSFSIVGPEDGGPAPAPERPESGQNVSVYVSLPQRNESDPPRDWVTSPDTQLEIDAAPDGLSGTVTFEALEFMTFDAPEPPGVVEEDSISGTISWTCE